MALYLSVRLAVMALFLSSCFVPMNVGEDDGGRGGGRATGGGASGGVTGGGASGGVVVTGGGTVLGGGIAAAGGTVLGGGVAGGGVVDGGVVCQTAAECPAPVSPCYVARCDASSQCVFEELPNGTVCCARDACVAGEELLCREGQCERPSLDGGVGTYSSCEVIRALVEEHVLKEHNGFCTTLMLEWPSRPRSLAVDAPRPGSGDAGWYVAAWMHEGSCALAPVLLDGGRRPVSNAVSGSGWVRSRMSDGGWVRDLDVSLTFPGGGRWPTTDRLVASSVALSGQCAVGRTVATGAIECGTDACSGGTVCCVSAAAREPLCKIRNSALTGIGQLCPMPSLQTSIECDSQDDCGAGRACCGSTNVSACFSGSVCPSFSRICRSQLDCGPGELCCGSPVPGNLLRICARQACPP